MFTSKNLTALCKLRRIAFFVFYFKINNTQNLHLYYVSIELDSYGIDRKSCGFELDLFSYVAWCFGVTDN